MDELPSATAVARGRQERIEALHSRLRALEEEELAAAGGVPTPVPLRTTSRLGRHAGELPADDRLVQLRQIALPSGTTKYAEAWLNICLDDSTSAADRRRPMHVKTPQEAAGLEAHGARARARPPASRPGRLGGHGGHTRLVRSPT